MRKSCFIIVLAAICASTNIYAQEFSRFIAKKVEQCDARIGPDILTFSFYQPLRSREQFCDDIPDIGETVIVIDSLQDELRDMMVEVRILRDTGDEDGKYDGKNIETIIPAKQFIGGTLKHDHNFRKSGSYIALVRAVSLDRAKEYNAYFYFSVGQSSSYGMLSTAILTIAVFTLALAFYKHALTGRER
jgi:hypothetical protein